MFVKSGSSLVVMHLFWIYWLYLYDGKPTTAECWPFLCKLCSTFVNLLYIVGFEYSYNTKHYLLLNIKIDTQISFIIFFPLSWISNSFWSINSSFVSGKPVSVLTSRIQLFVLTYVILFWCSNYAMFSEISVSVNFLS